MQVSLQLSPSNEITDEHYTEVFDTNVKGPILAVKEALPNLNDNGSILFTKFNCSSERI